MLSVCFDDFCHHVLGLRFAIVDDFLDVVITLVSASIDGEWLKDSDRGLRHLSGRVKMIP